MNTKKLLSIMGIAAALSVFAATLAQADVLPVVATVIQNGSNAAITNAPIGTGVHDVATVASTTAATPTGTVSFNVYNNTSCSGTSTVQSGVALVGGIAQSGTTTVPTTGLSYLVSYNGDSNNIAATGTCEALVVTAPNSSINTTLSTSTTVLSGTFVSDNATLSNITANASGTVAYAIYTDNECTVLSQSAGTVTVTNGLVPSSNNILFTTGNYWWQAVYSGDTNNAPATSTCGSEQLNVVATSTTLGNIVVDEVTNPSGDPASFQFTTTGSGYAGFSLADQTAPNNQTLQPGTYTISQSPLAGWTLSSALCSVNGSTGGTYAPGSALTLTPGGTINCTFTDTKQATTSGAGTISGIVFNDQNKNDVKDASEPGLSGWTVWLHQGAGKYNAPIVATSTTDGSGNYSFTNLGLGSYFVEEQEQTGWTQTSSDTGVALTSGNPGATVNFANVMKGHGSTTPVITPGTISGIVFNDQNKNDMKDASEPGLSGWTVWLHKGGSNYPYNAPIVATTTTDASGNYSFGNLVFGNYFVEEQEQAGWTQTSSDSKVGLNASHTSGVVNFANVMKDSGSTGSGGMHDSGKGNNNQAPATSTDQGHGHSSGSTDNTSNTINISADTGAGSNASHADTHQSDSSPRATDGSHGSGGHDGNNGGHGRGNH